MTEAALPPVGNQGDLMSCAAFGMAYNQVSFVSGNGQRDLRDPANQSSPALAYRLAIQSLKETCRQNQVTGGTYSVHYLDAAIRQLAVSNATIGYPDVLRLDPSAQCDFIDGIQLAKVVPDKRFGIGSWSSLDPRNLERIKDYLAQGQILAFSAKVQENLSDFTGPGVYRGAGRVLGGHVMVLTGYDDARQAFRVRNSWAPGGDGGSMWMAYTSFASSATEVYLAEPVREEPIQSSGSRFTVQFEGGQPGPQPSGAITRVHQEPAASGGVVLVLFYQFDQGVQLQSVNLQSPSGKRLRHAFGQSTRTGYYYFTRQDGSQWLPGNYPEEMAVSLPGGSLYTLRATVQVAPASGSDLPAGDFPAQVTGVDGRPAENLQ